MAIGKANTVTINIIGDATKFQKVVSDVESSTAGFGKKVNGVFGGMSSAAKGALAGVGVASVASFGKELFNAGARIEQLGQKAKIVFGDSLRDINIWASESANKMGLTRAEASGLAAGLGDLLVPMGFTREAAAKMSTQVLDLSGALAAWSGGQKSAAEVADILQSAMLGEMDALKGLGIDLSASEIQAHLAARGQDKLTGASRKQAEALAVQELLLLKSKDAMTAFNDATVTTAEKQMKATAQMREGFDRLAVATNSAVTKGITGIDYLATQFANFTVWIDTYGWGALWGKVWSPLAGGFKASMNRIIGWWNAMSIPVPKVLGQSVIPGVDRIHFPDIPMLAKGAIVTSPTLAMVGEAGPEAVVPLDRAGRFGAGAAGNVTNIYLTVQALDPRAAERGVVDALEGYFSRGGIVTNGRGGSLKPA